MANGRRVLALRCPGCGCPDFTHHYRREIVCDGCGADWPVFEAD